MNEKFVMPGLAAVFILFVTFFYVSKTTPGMLTEATDWAMYVTHAHNIVKGRPYTETKYVFQPESTTEVGSNAYPSGLPLLLAPIYAVEGLNIKHYKYLNCLFLALSLWPAYMLARQTLSGIASLLLIIVLGFSWIYLASFDLIGSDAPYAFISLWVLILLLRIYRLGLDETNPWTWGLWSGLTIAVAYIFRPIGLSFLLAVGGFELLRKRKISAFLLAVATAFVPLMLLNNMLFHADGGYTHQISSSVSMVAHHALEYLSYTSYLFLNPVSKLYRFFIWGFTFILLLVGLARRVRGGTWGITELYVLVMMTVNCVYWSTTARYLLPVLAIYLIYVFEGFEFAAERIPARLVKPLSVLAAVLILFVPAANAVHFRSDPTDTLVTSPPFDQLCAAVRSQTDSNALIVFWTPRVLVLSTDRFSSGWPVGPPDEIYRYLNRVRPGYIITDNQRPDDRQFLIPALAGSPSLVSPIFENGRFRLLRYVSPSLGRAAEKRNP
jgi:hypothetical protein